MPLPFLKFFVSVDEKNGCRTSNNQIALNSLLKREFWHGRDWSGWTPARFIEELGGWIGRYNTDV